MMSSPHDKPRLRAGLDIVPVEHEDEQFYAVRDPLGLAHEPILVPAEVLFIMSLMNGENTVLDMQVEFTKRNGVLIMSDKITNLLQELEVRGFLDSPTFHQRLREIEEAYAKTATREASHSGQAYPSTLPELEAFLNDIVPLPDGRQPGQPVGSVGSSAGSAPVEPVDCVERSASRLLPKGLIAPHIDIDRGRQAYSQAYSALVGTEKPHTAVIFGTGHYADGNTYILTKKDFATPLGTSRYDHEFCERLTSAYPADMRRGELAHRAEHSIEFQVLFLQHLYGTDSGPSIVPILGTSFDHLMGDHTSPSEIDEVGAFVGALEAAIAACPGKVLLIAGADLCHVGPKFGAQNALDTEALQRIEAEDRKALEAGIREGADAFYREVARIENHNHICSVTSIYTVLKTLENEKSELLHYGMALEDEGHAAVGFSAVTIGG